MSEYHDLSGEKKDQLLILTDKKGNKLGTDTRSNCHKGEGRTHLAFIAFILTPESEIILTKRSQNKSLWPHFWDASAISHVLPNETVVQAANRRGKEELGLDVNFKDLGAFFYHEKHGGNSENEYCHILVGRSNEHPDFNPVEIAEIKLMAFEDLKKEVKENPDKYTPWLKLAINFQNLNEYVN